MRAMILAAGLGTRLRPLSDFCAKPAMPVRGIPVIAHSLHLLAEHGVSEVIINLHHLPETVQAAVERWRPAGVSVRYSHEPELLGTGGAIRAAADFLRESDPAIVLAGDMILDLDLTSAVKRHRERGDRYTLVIQPDHPRSEEFGTLGIDAEGSLRRIGERFELGGETSRGLFLGVRIAAARAFEDWPRGGSFEDLTDWIGPIVRAGARDVRGEPAPRGCVWDPVGTLEEYLEANLDPATPSYRSGLEAMRGSEVTRFERDPEVVIGNGAEIGPGARLRRVVVWSGECVPPAVDLHDGVFAAGRFHAIDRPSSDLTR